MKGLLRDVATRVVSLVTRDREAREMAEEMRFHLEQEVRKNEAAGMSPREARRAAHIAFGGVERWTESWREARGVGFVERVAREARLAVRRLIREPSLSIPALCTLALGLAATAAVFSLVHTILLSPLPYPESDRLVEFGHATPALGVPVTGQSAGTWAYYRDENSSFAEVALFYENALSVSLTDGDAPEHVRVAMVTPSFFRVLGVTPVRGRLFDDGEGYWEPGEPRTPVLISEGVWVRRYGADPSIVGGEIEINQSMRRVIGVMPRSFAFPHVETDVWYVTEEVPRSAELRTLSRRAIGRLRSDTDIPAAVADLDRLVPGLADRFTDVSRSDLTDVRAVVTPLRDVMVRDVRQPLVLLSVTALLVLAVTLANVCGLLLVRTERRRRELAVAGALGAGRADFVRRFLVEGVVLAGAGGWVGGVLASILVNARFGFGPADLPRLEELRFGWMEAAVTSGVVLFVALVVAGVMLARASSSLVGEGGRPTASRTVGARGWSRVHQGLASVQVALSVTLLVGSVAMSRTLVRALSVDPGFEAEGALSFQMQTPGAGYPTYADAAVMYRESFERMRDLPGVNGVAAVSRLPLTPAPEYMREHVVADGAAAQPDAPPAMVSLATPDYFRVMGIPVLEGEPFGELVGVVSAPPVVLSRGLADRLFGDAPAVGRRIRVPSFPERYGAFTVSAVVGDTPSENLTDAFEETLYVPILLNPGLTPEVTGQYPFVPGQLAVVMRTRSGAGDVVSGARRIVASIDGKVPLYDVRGLDDLVSAASARLRLVTLLSAIAALAALGLGVAGVYGIVAYSVSRRTSEIGLRLALGSTSPGVERLILREVAGIAFSGVVAGAATAYLLSGVLRSQLYLMDSLGPMSWGIALTVVLVVVFAGGWLPARRARRMNIVQALGAEP